MFTRPFQTYRAVAVPLHWAKVANKPPRFVNIRQQNYSSVVAFQFTGEAQSLAQRRDSARKS
eukprot:4828050-Amphidinium_carterae.1